jgi:hypothetical protein
MLYFCIRYLKFFEKIFVMWVFKDFLKKQKKAVIQKERKRILRPYGKCYDLFEIYRGLNAEYFGEKLDLHISWFGSGKLPKSSILFGSFRAEEKLIKINRVLDEERIPCFFVRYIVYHEMLHAVVPPKRGKNGKWEIHHKEYKERERKFKEFSEAATFLQEWKKKHFASQLVLENLPTTL